MTKREAIDILELNRPFAESELQEAMDIAIQSLKKQTIPNCHDACDDYEEKE